MYKHFGPNMSNKYGRNFIMNFPETRHVTSFSCLFQKLCIEMICSK